MTKQELLNILSKEDSSITIKELCDKYSLEYKNTKEMIRRRGLTHMITKTDWVSKSGAIKLNKIDTKEKAYLVGFIAGDGHIDKGNNVSVAVNIDDREIVDFFSNVFGSNVILRTKTVRKSRRFPSARTARSISDIKKFYGGRLKNERSLPIVSKELEKYLLLGFFDADGCITWGHRKDRGRVWQKVSFTSQFDLLVSVQKILDKVGISTSIRPKSGEDCYILEFSSKDAVVKFYEWLYVDIDFIVLKRKFDKYYALRLELGEFGENFENKTIPSQAIGHPMEGVETTGGK